jgi:hypothetical protein
MAHVSGIHTRRIWVIFALNSSASSLDAAHGPGAGCASAGAQRGLSICAGSNGAGPQRLSDDGENRPDGCGRPGKRESYTNFQGQPWAVAPAGFQSRAQGRQNPPSSSIYEALYKRGLQWMTGGRTLPLYGTIKLALLC